MAWTRARVALQACLGLAGLAMLYVGIFQIGWLARLPCPLFGNGCESVALADFSRPFGLADGLLRAAWLGVALALSQVPRREAALGVVLMAGVAVGLDLLHLGDMHKLGAYCFWCLLAQLATLAALGLGLVSARQPFAVPAR